MARADGSFCLLSNDSPKAALFQISLWAIIREIAPTACCFWYHRNGVGVAPAFIAFPTDEDIFYVTRPTCLLASPADCDANGGSCASTVNCPYPGPFPDESCPAGAPVTTHLHAVAIWGAVALMAVLGMVMRVPGLYRIRAAMTTVRPLTFFGCTRAWFWHPTNGKSESMASPGPTLLRQATLDFFPRWQRTPLPPHTHMHKRGYD